MAVAYALVTLVATGAAAAVVLRPWLVRRSASQPPESTGTTREADGSVDVPRRHRLRTRLAAFGVVTVACVAGIIAITLHSHRQVRAASRASAARLATDQPRSSSHAPGTPIDLSANLDELLARPHALVLDTTAGPNFGRLEVLDAAAPDGPRAATALLCDRVDMRAGRGLCLTNNRVSNTQGMIVFGDHFNVLHTMPLDGLPSRTRVAPNGRIAAVTVFMHGDAYNVGNFATRTFLVDLVDGKVINYLEGYSVFEKGDHDYPVNVNYWGVTFADDSDTFYATLLTNGNYYLVRGHVGTARVDILRDGFECPSLSPDGKMIVYKSRISHGFAPATWRLHVLDLKTGVDHPLAETRSVDDQAAWLDDNTVSYGLGETGQGTASEDTWAVPADGSGAPVLLVPGGQSLVPAR
jgi:hypothetical protein